MMLVTDLDWVAKYNMMTSYMSRKEWGWGDPRIRMMDFPYHDLRSEKGLYFALLQTKRMDQLITGEEVVHAETHAPLGTRAYFRSACLNEFSKEVFATS